MHPGPNDAERRCEVLSFFLRHPRTSDSVEGLARWRLPDEVVFRGVLETERIVEELVEMGFLEEVQSPGGPTLFRLRPERAEEAVAFVRSHEGS